MFVRRSTGSVDASASARAARSPLRLVVLCLAIVSALGAGGCVKNSATGDSFFSTLSRDQEIAMGVQAAPQMTQEFGGEVPSPALQRYVSDLGMKLVAHVEPEFRDLPWTFTFLDSSVINAFALPGGKVFISRGLAERMTNEGQLAGVLGHEIGHVTAQHIARRIGQQTLIGGGLEVLGAAIGSAPAGSTAASAGQTLLPALNIGGQLTLLKFGRDEESQADWLGMRYMSRAGYNPRAQQQVMEILRDASKGGGSQPEWMSTHPLPDTRIARIGELLKTEYAQAANDPKLTFNEQRFQREFLPALRALPAPKQKASREEIERVRLAMATLGHTDACAGPCSHQPR